MAAIPVTAVYADTVETDPSTVVVSYTEYEMISDTETLLQMAQMQEQGIVLLTLNEDESRIEFAKNGDQVIVDQVLSETVYVDGSVEEDRANTAIGTYALSATSGSDTDYNTSSSLVIQSTIYYTYEIKSGGTYYILTKGGTKVTYNLGNSATSITQNLCYASNGYPNTYMDSKTHSAVPVNTEVYVTSTDYDEHGLTDHYYLYLNSVVTTISGTTINFEHMYNGSNEF